MDIIGKLKEIKDKFDNINEQLADPALINNQEQLIKLSKERSNLIEVVQVYDQYTEVTKNIAGNKELITTEDDELKELAEMELEELEENKITIEEKIKILLIPKDPDDDKNVIVEVRAGTGGDEAGLFANDLFRMYTRYAELKGWKREIMDVSESGGIGGIKEAS